jgi:hypothetical protein
MQELTDTVTIDAPAETVWAWLRDLPRHYLAWHPAHTWAGWIHGGPGELGAQLHVEEVLHGEPHRLRMVVTKIREDPTRMMLEYRILGAIGLMIPKGRFEVVRRAVGCSFTAALHVRAARLWSTLFRRRYVDLEKHLHEEGANLKALLEQRRG